MTEVPHALTSADLAEACQRIVEQAQEAIILADRQGVIQLWNRGAQVIFGFTAEEAVGHSLELIVPERFWSAHQAGYERAVSTGSSRYFGRVLTTRGRQKFGHRLYVDMSFGLLKDDSGVVTGVFAIARDCTERQLRAVAEARSASPSN